MRIRPAAAAITFAFAALAAARASACIWDSDTLAAEEKGLPGILDVLVGAFERNPPLYFEMRLARAEAAVAADPDDWAAYDDAGASCDRLGRGDEAVAWMDRKAERLRTAGGAAPEEHVYRRLANSGTFRAHRWLRGGADRARISEMEAARDEIAEAIRIRPDAHFGRERYQLRAMEWIAAPPAPHADDEHRMLKPDFLGLHRTMHPETGENGQLEKAGMADAVQGLAGLVVLGAAWESVDVFHALHNALAVDGRSSVALVASLRVQELIRAGRGSLLPGAPTGEALEKQFDAGSTLFVEDSAPVRAWYADARKRADAWVARREAFLVERLRAGRHPDTDPAFWDGWDPATLPSGDADPFPEREVHVAGLGPPAPWRPIALLGGAACAAAALAFWFIRRGRPAKGARRRAA